MAIDISSISTGISSTVGRLASSASSLTNFIPRTAGIQAMSTVPRQIGTAVSGIASQLQGISNPIIGAANTARTASQTIARLGASTGIIATTPPESLSDSIGGDFARAVQRINSLADEFVRSTGSASSKMPNPLRSYNHYNYIITLGILSIQEVNNPQTYRNSGFQKIILRSGGGQYDIRQKIFVEGGEDAEYFIENLDIDALISPNEKTGIALGTTISFEVTEPYSMGKFIEALIAGAASTGYNSFNNAPYCLKIEFVGWDEYGNQSRSLISPPYYVPIIITKVDFNVKEGGTSYQIQAVPYSEIALSRHIDVVNTEVSLNGRFVHEILENGELSVTTIVNSNISNIEENTTLSTYDRYIVLFPKTTTTIMEAISSGIITTNGMTSITDQALARLRGVNTDNFYAENPELRTFFQNRVSTRVNSEIYQILKSLSVDELKMNSLGLSELAVGPLSNGTQTFTPPQGVYDDAIFRVARRNSAAAQPSQRSSRFTFPQGSRITEIIERVLLDSKVVREEAQRDLEDRSPQMYRIETYTFIVDNPEVEKILGRSPRIYVYAVHPYLSDQAHYLAPNQKPRTTEQLKQNAVKEYNYFYTGKNEDILDFDIQYNYAFLQAAFSDFGQLTGTERVKTQISTVAQDQTLNISPPATSSTDVRANPSLALLTEFDRQLIGSQNTDASAQLAIQLHNIFINSNVDLINADLKIWGDPYYLPTILGNYSPAQTSSMLTRDSGINYLKNDVMIIINFFNPLDYQTNGSLMTFTPEVNPAFSGIYQVISVTSQFQKGQFIQNLKLLRQRGQEATSGGNERMLTTVAGPSRNSPQPVSAQSTASATGALNSNPSARLTGTGSVVDTRSGVWANEAISSAAGAASTFAQSLTSPITALSNVGSLLAGVPSTLRSVLPNVRINSNLTPRTTGQPTVGPQ